MKQNKTLLGIFIAYILAHILIVYSLSGVSEQELTGLGQALRLFFIIGFLWIVTLLLVIVLTIINKESWFQPEMKASTIALLVCCSILPVSALILYLCSSF